jgi:hypothetical protein
VSLLAGGCFVANREIDVGKGMADSNLSSHVAVLIPSSKKGIDSVYSAVIFLRIILPAVNTSPDKPDRKATKSQTIKVYDNLIRVLAPWWRKYFVR